MPLKKRLAKLIQGLPLVVSSRLSTTVAAAILLSACQGGAAAGQLCELPDAVRLGIPDPRPAEGPYETLLSGGAGLEDIRLGIGHLHYSADNPVVDLPPGEDRWLERVELPLSQTPGSEPWAWIASGWLLPTGEAPRPLGTGGLMETGYEEVSFIVLESRPDGWLRIRHSELEGDAGSAWTPSCALRSSPAQLDFALWSDWFLGEHVSPLYFRGELPEELRAEPSVPSTLVAEISGDHILEPIEIRGDWMRVTSKQPSDYCREDVESISREGWVRWYAEDVGPRVWYFTRGC